MPALASVSRISQLDQQIFDRDMGNPVQLDLDLKVSQVALKTIERNLKYVGGAALLSLSCIALSAAFVPITTLITIYAVKLVFDLFSEEQKTRDLPTKLSDTFKKALKSAPELYVPFFKKYGHLCYSVQFPNDTVPCVEIKDLHTWIKTIIKSEELQQFIDIYFTNKDTYKLPLNESKLQELIIALSHDDRNLRDIFGKGSRVDDSPEVQGVLERRNARKMEYLNERFKDLHKKLDAALANPVNCKLISLTDAAEILKACPNLSTESHGFFGLHFNPSVITAITDIRIGAANPLDKMFRAFRGTMSID